METLPNILVVFGSRSIVDSRMLMHTFDNASYIFDCHFDKVISGGGGGVDLRAKQWAEFKGYPFEEYNAKWDELGKRAGFIRNAEMMQASTHGIAVWDGQSKGTKMMIDLMTEWRKPLVVRYVY